jgi:hypothetical protein
MTRVRAGTGWIEPSRGNDRRRRFEVAQDSSLHFRSAADWKSALLFGGNPAFSDFNNDCRRHKKSRPKIGRLFP